MEISNLLGKLNMNTEYLKVKNLITQIKKTTNNDNNTLNKEEFIELYNQLKNPNLLPGFSFVIENELAGMMYPTKGEHIVELNKLGVGLVVNLTEHEYEYKVNDFIEDYDEKVKNYEAPKLLNLTIVDNTPPERSQVEEFFKLSEEVRKHGKSITVHCHAGKGRTGTMLALYLLNKEIKNGGKRSAEEIINEIREKRSGSICTTSQEKTVKEYFN
eukprot:TRINITY_DN1582_c0_g1_i1.p1 TRINITY_DN1582_c0_g1~~TRINITY_DN1582_c0_g1_i1.p1  ORF type:complete len:241 (-),score=60.80 TRINITY_DN1582_c0_g1_i1:17-661(-)